MEITQQSLYNLISSGYSSYAAAKELGISQVTVLRKAKKYNLSFKCKPGPKKQNDSNECFNCKRCGKSLTHGQKFFCSYVCARRFSGDEKVREWLEGTYDGSIGYGDSIDLSNSIREYLLKEVNYKCSRCGWSEINPVTGRCPLEIDHINGDWKNNRPENLRVLCPNCHSLTPTHAGLNKGNGQESRRYGNRGEYRKNLRNKRLSGVTVSPPLS